MCGLIARTNWSNIKSNYFVHTVIIFNLSYYTNIMITFTFVNQPTLHPAFFFFLQRIPRRNPVPSSTSICTYLVHTREFLMAPTNLTMCSGWPSFKRNLLNSRMVEWIVFIFTGISVCSPLFNTLFAIVVLDGFLSSKKGSSSTNWSQSPSFFLTWCDKQCCQTWLHPSNRGQCFYK